MINDGVQNTITDTKHEQESQCQSSKLGTPGKLEKRTLNEREFGQQSPLKMSFRCLLILFLLFEEAMDFPGDRGRGIKGGIDLDSFLPQVDEHAR